MACTGKIASCCTPRVTDGTRSGVALYKWNEALQATKDGGRATTRAGSDKVIQRVRRELMRDVRGPAPLTFDTLVV